MYTYLDIIFMAVAGCLLLGFIIKIRGHVDGGVMGVLVLSSISLAFFAPAIIYTINPIASEHDLKILVQICPSVEVDINSLNAPVKERELTRLYNECKPSLS